MIIVHVGMRKTGSTSIQESLAANLADPRFRYLQFGMPNGSLAIRNAYGPLNGFRPHADINDSVETRLIARRRAMKLITKALNNLRAKMGIISAENISSLSRRELIFLFDLLQRYDNNIMVVAYLRRPKSYLESVYQEKLKSMFVPLSAPGTVYRYRTVFQRFDDILGREHVSLRAFDPKILHKGCVVQDLCSQCGIEFEPAGVIRANESLSAAAIQLLYIYRKHYPRFHQRDKQIVQTLTKLQGFKFHLHSTLLTKKTRVEDDEITWASERVGADMSEDYTRDDGSAIRNENDMIALSAETVDWLAQRCGRRPSLLSQDMTAVAEAVASLGNSADAKYAQRSSADRVCHAIPQAP